MPFLLRCDTAQHPAAGEAINRSAAPDRSAALNRGEAAFRCTWGHCTLGAVGRAWGWVLCCITVQRELPVAIALFIVQEVMTSWRRTMRKNTGSR